MRYEDTSSSQNSVGSNPEARPDVDALNADNLGPATGNVITGTGTVSGAAGADSVDGQGQIVALRGNGGSDDSATDGSLHVRGRYGDLTVQTDGDYTYERSSKDPNGVSDVFTYTLADAGGDKDQATLTIDIRKEFEQRADAQQLTVGPDGVVVLPAGVQLSDVRVVGSDLIIILPDGSQMVIPNGAVFVPQLVIGDVQVPPTTLASLLIDAEPQPASGTPQSSGGNFGIPAPPLDPGIPLGDLIPPTQLTYEPPVFNPANQVEDEEPGIFIQPDGQPASVSAVDSVDERGLPNPRLNGANESVGSGEGADGNNTNNSDSSETTTGTIVVDPGDDPSVVTITGANGIPQAIVVGLVVQGTYGALTITGVNGDNYTYSYTLRDNTSGNTTADNFSVSVTDSDGDIASATLRIDIIDDVPTARPDTDSIAAGQFGPATGNVITDAAAGDVGDTDTNAADTMGADGASITAVSSVNVPANSDGSAPFVVNGQYGVLTLQANGDYSYVRNQGTPGGVVDTFNYTLTDGDGDTSTTTLTITIGDLGVTVNPNPVVRTDDDAVPGENGNPGGPGDDVDAENLSGTLSGSGGDGPLTFDLLTTGAPTGFTYVDGPNGSVLVQQVQNGSTVTVLTITINSSTGAYTVTQNAAILHPSLDGQDGDNTENNSTFTINYTVSDLDNDSAAGTLVINVDDDTPTVTVRQVEEEGVVLETQDADTIGAASDTDSSSANFGSVFSLSASLGADGGTAPALSYSLAVLSAVSGLTSHGVAINLYNVGGVIIGSTALSAPASANDASVVFTISVNGTGVVTLTQMQQIDHTNTDPSPTEAEFADHIIALADGKISLTATATATDGDNDSASDSETVDLGGNITFADDGPSISNVTAGASVTLDETNATPGHTPGSFPISAESSGAVISATQVFGADGAAAANSVVYGLALKGGVGSLLSNLETAVGGHDITLVLVDANTIEGRYTDGGTQVAFVIEMDTADGSITVTQYVPLEHLQDGSSAADHDDALDLNDLVEATITITDFDGDTADASAPIGDNIVFRDDGPSINVTQTGEGSVVLQTQDDDTIGVATDSDASTANFSGVFGVTSSGGADGTASVNTTYSLAVLSAVSGLTSHGVAINLYNVGGVIVGSTGLVAPASVNDASVVFAVSVNGSGVVTLQQMQQIDHTNTDPSPTGAGFEDHIIALADGKISLTASSTITDQDGDTASDSETIDLGGNITFADDGPAIDASLVPESSIRIDETDGPSDLAPGEVDPLGGNLGTVTVERGDYLVVTDTHVSADAPTTYAYALTLGTPGQNGLVNSGLLLSTTNAPIYLYNVGGVVVGSTALSAPASVNDASVVFTVSINASGDVTLTQILAVEHTNTSSHDELSSSLAAGALNVTVTATDFDGDTATDSVDLGSIIAFEDDGPSINVTQSGADAVLLTTQDAQTIGVATDSDATAINFAGVFGLTSNGGSDGAANTPSLAYSLQVLSSVSGLASHGVAINLYLVNGVVIGSTALSAPASTADASVVFAISVNSSGVVTLQQMQQIDHTNLDPSPTGGPLFDDHLIALANGKVTLTATATITDNDGDTASDSEVVDLGGNIRFADDGPDARNDTDAIAPGFFGIADGNVLTGVGGSDTFGPDGVSDISGADAPIRVSAITFGATTLVIAPGGSQVINGTYGQLTINSDGSYSYDRFDGSAGGVSDVFTYTIVDFDGDTDTATLTINIGINPPVAGNVNAAVDDDGLAGANSGANPNDINANTQPNPDDLDGAGSSEATFRGMLAVTGGDGDVDFSLIAPAGQVAVGQEMVTFSLNPEGTVLTATIATSPDSDRLGDVLFTVGLDKETGEYIVTLVDNVLHGDDANNDEDGVEVSVAIQYQVVDVGGSVSASPGSLTIVFNDDVPTARNDTDSVAAGTTGPATGNVITDNAAGDIGDTDVNAADTVGADGARVTFIDNTLNVAAGSVVPAGGSVVIAGQFGNLTIFANGDYSYTRTAGQGGGQSEIFQYTLTDADGDESTATLTISIADLIPTATTAAAAVDDDGLAGANTTVNPNDINANTFTDPDDLDGPGSSEATFRGQLGVTGGDGDIDFSLIAPGAGIVIGQETVSITGSGSLLTAVITSSPNNPDRVGDTLFTVSLDQETGQYVVTLLENILHADTGANDENGSTLSVNIGYQVVDQDGDPSGSNGTLNIVFNDDVPTVTTPATDSVMDPVTLIANGNFAFSLGADNYVPGVTTAATYLDVDLSGNVDGHAITVTQQPTFVSQVGNIATYRFDFTVDHDGDAGTPELANGGTVAFNLTNGTYTVTLDEAFTSTTIIPVSDVIDRDGWNTVGSSPSQFEIVVSELDTPDPVFVQFTAIKGPSNNTFTADTDGDPATGNAAFVAGDVFEGPQSWASITNTENGVAGDTIQSTDILNIDFFDASPFLNEPPDLTPNPDADPITVEGLTLDLAKLQVGEDLVVLLKLVSASDPTETTTKIMIIPYDQIFTEGEIHPVTGLEIGNDLGYVVIENNDFNTGSTDWVISGAQMIMSTQNITGQGIVLNGALGEDGATTQTLVDLGGATVDSDVIKIVDIGLIRTTTTTQEVQLTFDVTVTDQDGDSVTDQFVVNPTVAPLAPLSAETTSTKSTKTVMESYQAANNNTLLAAAAGAAGVVSTQAAAEDSGPSDARNLSVDSADHGNHHAARMDGGVESSSLEGSSDGTAEASAAKAAAPSVQPAPAAAESHGVDGGAAANDAAPAAADLLEGTDAPAQDSSPVTAASVAMPSAEMLQAANDGGKNVADNGDANSVAEVAKVIADALAGGEGAGHHGDIDALLAGLPGGEHGAQVALEALATQPGADVPAWDMGGAGAFAQHAAMSMDAAAMHQDAGVQHA